MSKSEKLLERLKSVPADFTWNELVVVLSSFGYSECSGDGSRRFFLNKDSGHKIRLHKPHPGIIVKKYALRQVLDSLKSQNIYVE